MTTHIPSDYIEDAIAKTQAYHPDCPPVRVVRVPNWGAGATDRIVVFCERCSTSFRLDEENA